MTIKRNPSARIPRRGLSSAQASGSDFHASFFFSAFLSAFTSGSSAIDRLGLVLSPWPIGCRILLFHYILGCDAHGMRHEPSIRWGRRPKNFIFPLNGAILAAEGESMRNAFRLNVGLTFASLLLATTASAQFKNGNQATELALPTLSQHAVVTQRIGLTDVTINYHAPLVGGRKLFGAAPVPYDKV